MSARDWVEEGASVLLAAGVPEARIKAEWWAAEVAGVARESLDTVFPGEPKRRRFDAGIARLARHEPLQYVIGHTPFLELDLITDARALIPRPETEELAMRVLGCAPLWARGEVAVADVGTGTGCLGLAVAARRPAAQVVAIDCSEEALALARENAARNGLGGRVEFRRGDLLEGVVAGSLDAVVSNPPYIASGELAGLDISVRDHEPRLALDGGPDGLAEIRRLVVQAFTGLRDGGRLWLEIGEDQGDAVRALLAGVGFQEVAIERDMYGHHRFAEGKKCFPS